MMKLFFLFLFLIFISTCSKPQKLNPEEVAQKFWEYSSSDRLKDAADLTCVNRNCGLGIKENENVTEFPYLAKLIGEWQIKSTKIIDIKINESSAQVILDATSRFNSEFRVFNCLRKEVGSGEWKISGTGVIEVFKSVPDLCEIEPVK